MVSWMLSQILLGKSLVTGKGIDKNMAMNMALKYSENKLQVEVSSSNRS